MKKLSCIIPTLWKSDEIQKVCDDLSTFESVSEIILIDNDFSNRKIDFSKYGIRQNRNPINNIPIEIYGKFKVLVPKENLYVSEPWNLGAKLAKENLICILNDDIIISEDVFEYAIRFVDSKVGILGVATECYYNKEHKLKATEINYRPLGFGFCMFMLKSKYVPIPAEIRVWYNDDFLFKKVKGKHYYMPNIKISGTLSKTNHLPELQNVLNPIREQDRIAFERIK